MTIRIIRHEVIPKQGNFEVSFSDGRPSKYFYWDDEKSRRLRPELVEREAAKAAAEEFARGERDKAK